MGGEDEATARHRGHGEPGGGGGVTGAAEVARAQPDGHTFLFGNTSTQVLIPAIMPNPPYDPLKDFIGIYILCNAPTSIVVHASVPARNLAELIAYAKANPGKLSYGSAGAGTVTNLAGELFKQLIGAPDIVHIPYKSLAALHIRLCASMGVGLTTCNTSQTLHWTSYASTAIYAHGRDSPGT